LSGHADLRRRLYAPRCEQRRGDGTAGAALLDRNLSDRRPVGLGDRLRGPADGSSAAITETVKGAAKSFNHATSIDVLPGAVVSRSVDDLSLSPLDLRYTLHLTLAYRGGAASIEHALLLPGAVRSSNRTAARNCSGGARFLGTDMRCCRG